MTRRPSMVVGGAVRAMALAPGIVPLGALFGAAAVAAGLSPLGAIALSALVFAGGAQFASVAILAQGASALSAVLLVGVINARYLLLSTGALEIARRVGAGRLGRSAVALGVVDESYALQAAWTRAAPVPLAGLLSVPLTLWTLWVGGTAAGAFLGASLPDLRPLGLDYALPGIFVGLFGIFAEDRRRLVAGLAALAAAGLWASVGFGTAAVLVVPPALALSFGRWANGA
ncbi:MAG: AzlC family ABC transporter permease [Methanobacteriota archaeon]